MTLRRAIDDALGSRRWLISLDRDGTLVPYANRPEEALVTDRVKKLIGELAACKQVIVAILSARSSAQLAGDFQGTRAILAGNYGMEVVFADGRQSIQPQALNAVPALKAARDELSERLDLGSGVILEDHGYSLCLHWHNVPVADREMLHSSVEAIADRFADLRFRLLPTSYEVLPDIGWNKGAGLAFLTESVGGDNQSLMHFFAGDTAADTPAFIFANEHGGISVRVGADENLGAQYRLDKPADLHDILQYILDRLKVRL